MRTSSHGSHRRTDPACVDPAEHAASVKRRHGADADLNGMRGVLLLFQESAMLRMRATHHLGEPVNWVPGGLSELRRPNGTVAVCGGFGIGAPAVAIAAEQLISLGARRIIAIGTAGTLQPHVRVGDIVLCDRAVRSEGVSNHYWEDEKYAYPSTTLTRLLGKELETANHCVHTGASWTTDALYRETRRDADRYASEGVLTVEMEAAALFAVCLYRNVECAASFAISDSLAPGLRGPRRPDITASSFDSIIYAAVSALLM